MSVRLRTDELTSIFHTQCRTSGITPSTLLHQFVPYIAAIERQDLIIETPPEQKPAEAAMLALLTRWSSEQPRGSTKFHIIISPEPQPDCLPKLAEKMPVVVAIGFSTSVREELHRLSRPYDILISTPERLIDHLRRDNIAMDQVGSITILNHINPEDTSGFLHDVQFIFTKFTRHPQAVLFTERAESSPLKPILYRPRVITWADWGMVRKCVYTGYFSNLQPEHIIDTVYAWGESNHLLVICRNTGERKKIRSLLKKEYPAVLGEAYSVTETLPDSIQPTAVIFYNLDSTSTPITAEWITRLLISPLITNLYCLARDTDNPFCRTLKEYVTMKESLRAQNGEADQQQRIAGKIKILVERIQKDKHPEELQAIRKLIKREVPLSMRRYITAYLLRDYLGETAKPGKRRMKSASSGKQELPEGTTLFLSTGKNRRVFPKDLSTLFQQEGGIAQEHIIGIKVLDKFSFVTVADGYAPQAIEKLHGITFRGRTLTCDFAKKKD